MPFIGTLSEIAATTHREVDRARIHSYECLSVHRGPYVATLFFKDCAM